MNPITNLHQNQNKVIVLAGYDNTTTNITLASGHGTILPDPSIIPYNLIWWNASDYLNPTDDPSAEVVKCIAKIGDTLIIMRSQQQTLASPKNIPGKLYNMALLPDTLHDNNLDTNLETLSYYNVPQTHGISIHTGIIGDHSTNLSSVGTNTHAQIDTAITASIGHIAASGTSVHSLGTMSTQSAGNVTITGGSITGITSIGIGTVSPIARLEILGSGTGLPPTSGTTVSAGEVIRIRPGDNAVLDIGGNSVAGAWLQSTDQTGLQSGYPLLLNPNGGNVGIGTTSPNQKLDVVGNPVTLGVSISSTQTVAKIGSINSDGYAEIFSGEATPVSRIKLMVYGNSYLNGGNVGIGTTTPTSLLDVNGTAQLRGIIGGTGLTVDAGGKVGIGTTSPNTMLEILKTASGALGPTLRLTNGGGGIGAEADIEFYDDQPMGKIKFIRTSVGGAYTDLAFATHKSDIDGMVEHMRITNAGNVGIGTMAPGGKLELKGIGNHLVITDEASVNKQWIMRVIGSGLDINEPGFGSRLFVKEGGNVGIGTTTPGKIFDVVSNIGNPQYCGGGIEVDGVYTTKLHVTSQSGYESYISKNASTGIMTIHNGHSGGNINLEGGNVGIGTTSPTQKLHVAGNLEINAGLGGAMRVYSTNSRATEMFISALDSLSNLNLYGAIIRYSTNGWDAIDGGLAGDNTSALEILSRKGGANTSTFTKISSEDGPIIFATGGVDSTPSRMLISSTGNVGIGVTTPVSKLQVGTSIFSGENGVFTNERILAMFGDNLTTQGGSALVYQSVYNDATYPSYGLVFIDGPSTLNYNVWSISPDGPAKGDSLNFLYGAQATNIHTATPKVVFDGNGNVGIGTATPATKLDINTGSNVGTTNILTLSGLDSLSVYSEYVQLTMGIADNTAGSEQGNLLIKTIQGGILKDILTYNTVAANALLLLTNGLPALTILSNGNTGIGTTSPTAKLHIGGTPGIDGIKFPDGTIQTTATWQSEIFTKGGNIMNSAGVPNAALNTIIWIAPFVCTVTAVKGYRVGGTGAAINARKNGSLTHLSTNLSVTSADAWMDGGAVQNTAYAVNDKLEIMIASTAGTVTQLGIQVNFTSL